MSIQNDLNELLHANIITQETAEKIAGYYQQKKSTSPNKLTAVLGILGALLLGSGIVLIIAHNWDELSRITKTIFAFLPLVIAQLLCACALRKQPRNKVWDEASSVLLFFAIGTSISLISQIYHVSGSLSGFLLTWMLLALPLVYILSSSIVALLIVAGITWYACEAGYFDRSTQVPYAYIIVLLLLIPHYLRFLQSKSNSNYFTWLNWFLVLSLLICLGSFTQSTYKIYEWMFYMYLAFCCLLYNIGRLPFFRQKSLMANPFLVLGAAGILFILFFWSFQFLWQELDNYGKNPDIFSNTIIYIAMLLTLAAFITWLKSRKIPVSGLFDPTGISFSLFFLLIGLLWQHVALNVFMVNIWILLISLFFIRRGAKEDHLGILNFGLIIIAILAICRFFDEQIPFLWRGAFFVIAGAGFFVANSLILRKRKQLSTQKEN